MQCHRCGAQLVKTKTDLPFKIDTHSIVIIKEMPVLQCSTCIEYEIEDQVMTKVEKILDSVDKSTELEIVRFAA